MPACLLEGSTVLITLKTRLRVDAERLGRGFLERLLLRLHDVGQLGIARLVEAQVGRDDRRDLQNERLEATIDLACDREALAVHAHLRRKRALAPAQQGRQHLARLIAIVVDGLLAHDDKLWAFLLDDLLEDLGDAQAARRSGRF